MKRIFVGNHLLYGLKSMSLLGIVGLAVLALGPGLLPIFGTDGAGELALNRPAAPAVAKATQPVPVIADGTEAIVLANWEFTSKLTQEATKDVLKALQLVDQANLEAAAALLAKNSKAAQLDGKAAISVLAATVELAEAAAETRSRALAADAEAMLLVYIKMYHDIQTRNTVAVYQDTLNAEKIASKAVLDASPYR